MLPIRAAPALGHGTHDSDTISPADCRITKSPRTARDPETENNHPYRSEYGRLLIILLPHCVDKCPDQ